MEDGNVDEDLKDQIIDIYGDNPHEWTDDDISGIRSMVKLRAMVKLGEYITELQANV
jgi:hypothetical protein